MKKIHLLVLKAFIRPFIVTFFIVMFVLLMFFLFKYIDDLIGKGFEWYIILELLWYASATNVAMALPLAVLLSSIMTFGSLGENYELVAIKSAGLSLQKAMRPLIAAVGVLSLAAFLFSDYMLPVANLKMINLLYDVRKKSANFLIEEGIFNNSIPGYSIRVQKKDKDEKTLYGIQIYEKNEVTGSMSVIRAKKGTEELSKDKHSLVLTLEDGVRYEETRALTNGYYDPRRRFMRQRFRQHEQRFDLSAFDFQRTDESAFRNSYQMMSLRLLNQVRDSVELKADSAQKTNFSKVEYQYKYFSAFKKASDLGGKATNYSSVTDIIPKDYRINSTINARSSIRQVIDASKVAIIDYNMYIEPVRSVILEYNRKFTLSISCLLLFSIGAPLGAIIRKGGLGLPVVMSVLFFLIYHVISTIAEKSARDGIISPVLGMWMAIIVLTPVGIFLTYKATVDSTLFDIDAYKQFFQKIFKKKKASPSA